MENTTIDIGTTSKILGRGLPCGHFKMWNFHTSSDGTVYVDCSECKATYQVYSINILSLRKSWNNLDDEI